MASHANVSDARSLRRLGGEAAGSGERTTVDVLRVQWKGSLEARHSTKLVIDCQSTTQVKPMAAAVRMAAVSL
eukprot:scaffold116122_cov69-Phaeocystis_antarctica.AAC.2